MKRLLCWLLMHRWEPLAPGELTEQWQRFGEFRYFARCGRCGFCK